MSISKENQITTDLRLTINGMNKDIEYIKEALLDNKKEHGEIRDMIKDFIESSPKHFASAWVEVAAKAFIGAIILAVLGAVLSDVITK